MIETEIDFEKGAGLVPAVVQDASDGTVLMLGYMNEDALALTRQTGRVTFFSRRRRELWTKGETSGHFLKVVDIVADCDGDTLLIRVDPTGPACHTGARSCFHRPDDVTYSSKQEFAFLRSLQEIIRSRTRASRDSSYTAQLLAEGPKRIAQKVGEEAIEIALEAVGNDERRLVGETADLLYHLMVLLEACGTSLDEVVEELERRHSAAA